MRQPWQNLQPDTQRYAGLQEATLRRLYKEAGSRPTTSMVSLPRREALVAAGRGDRLQLVPLQQRNPSLMITSTLHARSSRPRLPLGGTC